MFDKQLEPKSSECTVNVQFDKQGDLSTMNYNSLLKSEPEQSPQ